MGTVDVRHPLSSPGPGSLARFHDPPNADNAAIVGHLLPPSLASASHSRNRALSIPLFPTASLLILRIHVLLHAVVPSVALLPLPSRPFSCESRRVAAVMGVSRHDVHEFACSAARLTAAKSKFLSFRGSQSIVPVCVCARARFSGWRLLDKPG